MRIRLLQASCHVLVPLVMFVAVVGCGSPAEPGEGGPIQEITELPRALTVAESRTISAANRFGFDLLAELYASDPDRDLFMSPLSAHMALGMALNGAKDSTFAAIASVLGFDATASLADINASYAGVLALLSDLDPNVEFEIANSVWYEQSFPFRPAYLDAVRGSFDAEVSGLDFANPSSVTAINDWVSGKTNGKIDKMLDALSPSEVMFLLNAIYFKGDWTVQFDRDRTYDGPFTRSDGSTKTVKMMVREEGDLAVGYHDTFEVVDLPYGGGAFRMTIVLPAPGVPLASRLDGLQAADWEALVSGLTSARVPVEMPRFRLEWEKELKETLQALGMDIAFTPGQANFGGMLADGLDPLAPGTDLHITRVKQKSFVDVNEEGTEAAAATSVGIGVTSAPVPIVVDRPFFFAIRERLSGTVLFLGVIQDPDSN